MTSTTRTWKRSLTLVAALAMAATVGLSTLSAPASAAYAPQVKLSQYTIVRGHWDAALLSHFRHRHRGVVVTWQGGQRIVLKVFYTGRYGGALFAFHVLRVLRIGYHWLIFRTGILHVSVRIRVRR